MSACDLSIRATYSDNELDNVLCAIHHDFPMYGCKQMSGHLWSRGLGIQQHRIHEAMRQTDPGVTIACHLHALHRCHYSVPAPRSLYHIDGNHKLIW